MQKAYSKDNIYDKEKRLISYYLSKEVISLPIGPHMSMEEINYVINTLNSFHG